MKNKLKIGDKVCFKENYDGAFIDFKGKTLTVLEVYEKDDNIDFISVRIKEISSEEKYHLINSRHLEKIN